MNAWAPLTSCQLMLFAELVEAGEDLHAAFGAGCAGPDGPRS